MKLFSFFLLFSLLFGKSNAAPPIDATFTFDRSQWMVDHDLFFVHCIPKCGTHFIQDTLTLMTGQDFVSNQLSKVALEEACRNNEILRFFQPFSKELNQFRLQSKHKCVAMVRDIRDALISHLMYMDSYINAPEPRIQRDFFRVKPGYDDLSLEDRITYLINGEGEYPSYIEFFKSLATWSLVGDIFSVKFEELVGAEGGGSDELKRETIRKLGKFINYPLTEEKLEYVLQKMYKKRPDVLVDPEKEQVFTRASIGNWKNFLTREHKKMIKKRAGKLLIAMKYEKDLNW